jgi:hypothetical protein
VRAGDTCSNFRPRARRSTADDIELEVLHRCGVGGTAMFAHDLSRSEVFSPGSSAPSIGWVSLVGNEALVALFNEDLNVSRVFKRRLLPVPAERHGPRNWLLVARAVQQGLSGIVDYDDLGDPVAGGDLRNVAIGE